MKSQARLRLRQPEEIVVTMVIINGRPFRCPCGSNCFLRQGNRFTCNACGKRYEGTP